MPTSPANNTIDRNVEVLNIRADALRRRTPLQRTIARISGVLSNPWFFVTEVVFHAGWIALNAGALEDVRAWDPYPYSFLTGLASVQALFIGLLVLMYAQHEAAVAEIREELDLQVALHSERETSKLLRMLTDVHERLGIVSAERDVELQTMSRPLDPNQLRSATEEHIREAEEREGG